nr:uncharacterized protein LOC109169177 [Ipomoea trifida]
MIGKNVSSSEKVKLHDQEYDDSGEFVASIGGIMPYLFAGITHQILPNINDEYKEDLDIVAYELTGRVKQLLTPKATVKSVILTYTYALLMSIKHQCYVKVSLDVFLHKIANGVNVNLGPLLFDQVLEARDGKRRRYELILPNMIFCLLVMQEF